MDKWLLLDLGTAEYASVLDLQHRLVRKRVAGTIPNTLILVEHPHVITLGRRAEESNIIEARGVPVVRVERGGDVTYHGPGQLVGYPILSLAERGNDLRKYVRDLEGAIIETCERFGVMGRHVDKKPGVWITDRAKRERKIASIGVAVSHWVTYHGFALNVNTDLGYFQLINPCGYSSDTMTSIAEQVGQRVVFDEVKEAILESLAEVLGADVSSASAADLADGWPKGAPVASVDDTAALDPTGAAEKAA
jgi:lipoate-protein ligase B